MTMLSKAVARFGAVPAAVRAVAVMASVAPAMAFASPLAPVLTAAASVHAQAVAAPNPSQPAACPPLLNQTFDRLQDEKPQSLCQYAGKVLLVVNTASYCGFTPQYEGLEALHAKYAARGLVVLGFPSNDFGQQEPGEGKQIAEFCFNTYGVRFPMFSKTVVKGRHATPLYAELAKATGSAPGWNFHKYLIDRQGKPIASFISDTAPMSAPLVAAIERALDAK